MSKKALNEEKLTTTETTQTLCMNCGNMLHHQFCATCGQKASTRRFSLKHFIVNDFVSAVLQLNKGFFYTLKELFTRPGHSIRAYVEGKRTKHFNYIAFLLILVGASMYLMQFSPLDFNEVVNADHTENLPLDFNLEFNENQKIILLISIPILALISFLSFKKAAHYYTEHLVLMTYKTAGEFALNILFLIITIFLGYETISPQVLFIVTLIINLYSVWFLYQYFSVFGYSKGVLIRKCLVITYVYNALVTIFIGIIYGFFLVLIR